MQHMGGMRGDVGETWGGSWGGYGGTWVSHAYASPSLVAWLRVAGCGLLAWLRVADCLLGCLVAGCGLLAWLVGCAHRAAYLFKTCAKAAFFGPSAGLDDQLLGRWAGDGP